MPASKKDISNFATSDAFSIVQAIEDLRSCRVIISAHDYRAFARIFDRINHRVPLSVARHRIRADICQMLDHAEMIEASRK